MLRHCFLYLLLITSPALPSLAQTPPTLAARIRADARLDSVRVLAEALLRTGLNAGDVYPDVWIRDLNTFINLALTVQPRAVIRDNLLMFFRFQGDDGNIIDGFVPAAKADPAYHYQQSTLAPGYKALKNTVETDQESSLVLAVTKYIRATGDRSILTESIGGKPVLTRLAMALDFLLQHRYSPKYGLLYGATTADWGDVQPESPLGVELDSLSHLTVDVYDNALFIQAITAYLRLLALTKPAPQVVGRWQTVRAQIRANVRRHLWDSKHQKFRPHRYLTTSPFPPDFAEDSIHFHGGTAVAIEADLLTNAEIRAVNQHLLNNVKRAGASSIGLTLYPTYPAGYFKNPSMYPYGYQNGGDWTWFGARMVQALTASGLVAEAYAELLPMVQRVLAHKKFYEWYNRDGTPNGSGSFRGEAGVLTDAIDGLRAWAEKQTK